MSYHPTLNNIPPRQRNAAVAILQHLGFPGKESNMNEIYAAVFFSFADDLKLYTLLRNMALQGLLIDKSGRYSISEKGFETLLLQEKDTPAADDRKEQ